MKIKIHEQKKAVSSSKNPLSRNFQRRRLKLKKIKRSLFYRWYMKNIYNVENKYKHPNINLNENINAINDPNKGINNFTIENRDEDRVETRGNTLTNENNLNIFENIVDKNKIEHLSDSFISKNTSPNTPVKFLNLKKPHSNSISHIEGNNNVGFIDNERCFSLLDDSFSPYIDNNTFNFIFTPIRSNLENCLVDRFNKFNVGCIVPHPPIFCCCCNCFNNNINDDINSNNINLDINNNNIIVDRNSGNNNRSNERNINNNNLANNSDISNRNVNENNIINNSDINNGNSNNLGNNNNNNTHNINNNLNQNNSRNSSFIDLLDMRRRRRTRRTRIRNYVKEIKNKLLTKKIIVKDISKLDDNKNSCVICLEKFKNRQKVYKLDCTHIFHIKCLNKEIKFRQKCPSCRKHL